MATSNKGFLVAAACLIILLCSPNARAERKVGVLMFSGELRYQDAARGMMERLREEGMGEPKTTFFVENAGANKAKALELVKKFAAAKLDLILTLGTTATVVTAREVHDIPIVFAVVYDPVQAGIAKSWKTSGNNTTGTCTKVPMSLLFDTVKKVKTVKKMALLYTPGEVNSESVYRDVQQILPSYGIKMIPVILTKKEDIVQILPAVMRTSDAIYVTGSNLIDSQISTITDMAIKGKVITITHLEDLVKKGVLLGVGTDSYLSGRLAGDKAIKILRGAQPSTLPIESLKERKIFVNKETLKAGQFQVPGELMKWVQ